MKIKETLFALALLAGAMNIGAQTPERSFYIDYGQNNVANQGYTTEGADANGHYWNNIHGNRAEEALQDEEGLQTMNLLGRNMAWLLKCIEAGKKAGIEAPETEQKIMTNFIR